MVQQINNQTENNLQLFTPTDEPFLTYVELGKLKQEAKIRAKQAEQTAQEAEAKVKELEAKLRELGQL